MFLAQLRAGLERFEFALPLRPTRSQVLLCRAQLADLSLPTPLDGPTQIPSLVAGSSPHTHTHTHEAAHEAQGRRHLAHLLPRAILVRTLQAR